VAQQLAKRQLWGLIQFLGVWPPVPAHEWCTRHAATCDADDDQILGRFQQQTTAMRNFIPIVYMPVCCLVPSSYSLLPSCLVCFLNFLLPVGSSQRSPWTPSGAEQNQRLWCCGLGGDMQPILYCAGCCCCCSSSCCCCSLLANVATASGAAEGG
jgi:hypothetical protein